MDYHYDRDGDVVDAVHQHCPSDASTVSLSYGPSGPAACVPPGALARPLPARVLVSFPRFHRISAMPLAQLPCHVAARNDAGSDVEVELPLREDVSLFEHATDMEPEAVDEASVDISHIVSGPQSGGCNLPHRAS